MLGTVEEAAAKGSTKGNTVEDATMKGMRAISKTECKALQRIPKVDVSKVTHLDQTTVLKKG